VRFLEKFLVICLKKAGKNSKTTTDVLMAEFRNTFTTLNKL